MLVLSRKLTEKIVLDVGDGAKVVISVAEIRGGSVRLSIEADRTVPVYRAEIWDQIKKAEQQKQK